MSRRPFSGPNTASPMAAALPAAHRKLAVMPICWPPLRVASVLFVLLAGGSALSAAQTSVTTRELTEYQLTEPVFEKFVHATRLLTAAMREDPRFAEAPLFTRDILVAGDAPHMAADLQKRLDLDPLLAGALFAADMHARDYTKFALSLFAARLAHGFVKSGVLRKVPAGVAEHNVEFVARYEDRIAALLKGMGVE